MTNNENHTNIGPYTVEISSSSPDWQDFLHNHPQSTIYHDPAWGDIMLRAYGNRPYYLTASRDGQIKAVLQLIAQKSLLFGSHLCSLPYFDAAGILTDDPDSIPPLIAQARTLLPNCRAQWIELRHLAPIDDSLPSRTDKVTMVLPLPASDEELWNQLKTKVRTKVRKARQTESTVVQGKAELLPEFYDVYVRTMRDLGSPPHSRRFFQLILDAFPDASKLYVVRHDDQAVAASFTLTDRHAFRVPWSGSDYRLRKLNVNLVLYWAMLEDACRLAAPAFDFGRSTRDSGTWTFKKQWGAEEVPLLWEYLLPPGASLPELRPDSPKYRFMVACWKKLPLPLARLLGPHLIRKLS
jgi:serine/alanine adding enzyme